MLFSALAAVLGAAMIAGARAESHTITFTNNCGFGTSTLVSQAGDILSTGAAYTSDGPIEDAIAYLQTGACGLDGESCTIVETTLANLNASGGGSNTEILLSTPYEFTVTTGFEYYNGCDGEGYDCTSSECALDESIIEVACDANNVDLAILFCD